MPGYDGCTLTFAVSFFHYNTFGHQTKDEIPDDVFPFVFTVVLHRSDIRL